MKRFFCCLISALLIFISVPAIPAEASSVAMSYDMALEIYLSLLSLLETGRLASGYQKSIFDYENYEDFQAFLSEYNTYLAEHSGQLSGIEYTTSDGTSALEDWVNEDWEKDGNIISGALDYKLSVLDSNDLNNFGSDNQNNNMNENNNNPFDVIKRVAITVGASVASGGIFALLKNYFSDYSEDSENNNPVVGGIGFSSAEEFVEAYPNQMTATEIIYMNGSSYYRTSYPTNPRCYIVSERYYLIYNYNTETWNTNYSVSRPYYMALESIFSGSSTYAYDFNYPVFGTLEDYENWEPHNFVNAGFDNDYLVDNIENSLALPLIDTDFRPFGFIGLQNGLSSAMSGLGLGSDPMNNSDLWLDTIPDSIVDILPDYIPYPVPDPVPLPDPLPDPSPDPEPDPDPLPDPDPVPDDGDLTEIPMVTGLEKRFPFSIPWDLKNLVSSLSAEREAPHFEYDFYISEKWLPPAGFTYHFDIDLSSFDSLASIFRRLFLISFIVGLAVYSYAKFFGGGE